MMCKLREFLNNLDKDRYEPIITEVERLDTEVERLNRDNALMRQTLNEIKDLIQKLVLDEVLDFDALTETQADLLDVKSEAMLKEELVEKFFADGNYIHPCQAEIQSYISGYSLMEIKNHIEYGQFMYAEDIINEFWDKSGIYTSYKLAIEDYLEIDHLLYENEDLMTGVLNTLGYDLIYYFDSCVCFFVQ